MPGGLAGVVCAEARTIAGVTGEHEHARHVCASHGVHRGNVFLSVAEINNAVERDLVNTKDAKDTKGRSEQRLPSAGCLLTRTEIRTLRA